MLKRAPKIHVRPMTLDDHKYAYSYESQLSDHKIPSNLLSELLTSPDPSIVRLVAVYKGQLVGFAIYFTELGEAFIGRLLSIGQCYIEATEALVEEIIRRNANENDVTTMVDSSQEEFINFLADKGFVYLGDVDDDKVLLGYPKDDGGRIIERLLEGNDKILESSTSE